MLYFKCDALHFIKRRRAFFFRRAFQLMNWFQAGIAHFDGRESNVRGLRAGLLWGVMGLLLLTAGPAQATGVRVTDVAFSARSDGQGYVMRVRTTDRPEAYMLRSKDARTLKWVLYNTTLHESYEDREPEGPVKRYTTTQQNGHLIFQVELKEGRSVSPTAYRDGASDDLLLNLVVVIDAGHGGKDPGAMANGLQEKNIVLDVAHQLGEYVENRLDLEVVYTRTDDRFIALEERGHLANRAGGDLFISIHANAFSSSSVHGTETYFLGRSKTDAARRVMRKENSVVREYEENPERYDEYDAEAFVKGELFLSSNMQFSEEFASLVQEQFKDRVHRRSRGVHQAGFYVLWSASMPSVLVELGYLTNPQEARFLNSDRGQVYLASAIFRAVREYKNKYNKGIAASE